MKMPEDIRPLLVRLFDNKHREWLAAEFSENAALIEIKLGMPTEQAALKQIAGVRAWVSAWQTWQGIIGQVCWRERRWQQLGIQRLPEKLILQGAEAVAAWIDQSARWRQACLRYQTLTANWPNLTAHLPHHFDILADYNEADFQRLSALLDWFNLNPSSNLYPRQLPIAGIDSKWLEQHKKPLTKLVAAMQADLINNLSFYQRCGLKAPPTLIRMRILDQNLRALVRGISDITGPIEDISQLNFPVTHVFIVENLQTGLAIPDLPGAVAFIGLGYHVDALAHLPWIASATCIYWGDIDTHGFAILQRARFYLPHLQSIMMDEETLLRHKILWVDEEKQHTADELPLLSKAEQVVYHNLKQQHWGQNIRLEQERIAWEFAWDKLQLSIKNTTKFNLILK